MLFEAVRRADYLDRPSRLQSIFAMATLAEARAFIAVHRAPHPCGVWRVRGELGLKANMALLTFLGTPGAGAYSFALAGAYWRGEQGPAAALWELLLVPPVEVLELVEHPVR